MKHFMYVACTLGLLIASGQDGKFNFGARSSGLGGASVTLGDGYSLFNNIGGLGLVESHELFVGYQNRYDIISFQSIGAGAILKNQFGSAGFGFYKFGDDLFNQQRFHVAIGNKFQLVSLGLGLDLLQYRIATVGSKQILAIQFGGVAEISSSLFFGAHIYNVNQAKLIDATSERVPTVMKGGISYRPTPELMMNFEIEKDLGYKEILKVGIEYQLIEKIYLRTGIGTNPLISSFGVGFYPKKSKIDYSFTNDSQLGSRHEISLAHTFMK